MHNNKELIKLTIEKAKIALKTAEENIKMNLRTASCAVSVVRN
jgi:hypothetical protein